MPRDNVRARQAPRGKASNGTDNPKRLRAHEADVDTIYQPEDVSHQLQQNVLNIFRDSLSPSSDDKHLVQEVKGHLYERNFAVAFGRAEYLRVYASRWSPSRALGYLQILSDIQQTLLEAQSRRENSGSNVLKIVSVGGGAGAELVGLGAWLSRLSSGVEDHVGVDASFVDIAQWDEVLKELENSIVTLPVLSKYASAAAREANSVMLSDELLSTEFIQEDVLSGGKGFLRAIQDADIITLMFTLNELYSTSVPATQQMLAHLTSHLKPNSHLLVVDSPGSYSTVTINGSEKRYPMQWLLDHTLLGSSQKRGDAEVKPKWEKLIMDESRWFRMPQELQYPIDLENMRYQIHLFRRLTDLTE